MQTKNVVTISREWHNPQINTKVNFEGFDGIQISIDIADFIKALAEEARTPTRLMSATSLREILPIAANRVLEKMKLESCKVMV